MVYPIRCLLIHSISPLFAIQFSFSLYSLEWKYNIVIINNKHTIYRYFLFRFCMPRANVLKHTHLVQHVLQFIFAICLWHHLLQAQSHLLNDSSMCFSVCTYWWINSTFSYRHLISVTFNSIFTYYFGYFFIFFIYHSLLCVVVSQYAWECCIHIYRLINPNL